MTAHSTARPHSRHLEELLPAFALGALDGDELRELLEHIAPDQGAAAALVDRGTAGADAALGDRPAELTAEIACLICAAELRRLADVVEAIAMLEEGGEAAPASPATALDRERLAPGADLRRRVLAQVAAEPRRSGAPPPASSSLTPQTAAMPPTGAPIAPRVATPAGQPAPPAPAVADFARRRRGPAAAWWPRLAAAALLLVAVWGVARQAGLASEIRRLRGERDQMAARADALERQVQQAQAQSQRLARTLSILAAPSVASVRLAAMGSSHAAGRTYVDSTDRKAVFYAFNLPALAPDKTYQLWYIDDEDRKVSAGVFQPDVEGKAAVLVEQQLPVERIRSWAVTIEPQGGRPQPTGPIALAG